MDENNNGPVPGIIGQDVPSDDMSTPTAVSGPEKDNGKIFDSSSFTGGSTESLTLNKGDSAPITKENKSKGQNPFTKWQLWAILSGVIAVAAAIAIVMIIIIFDGKVKNTEAVSSYDSAVHEIENSKEDFETAYRKMNYDIYGVSGETPSEYALYPSDTEYVQSKNDCLAKYDISAEDLEYIETLKTGSELLNAGSNVVEAKERVERISVGYNSAVSAINNCREVALAPVLKDFEITISELTTEPDDGYLGGDYVKFSQIIKVKYKGDKNLSRLDLKYALVDRNGAELKTRYVDYSSYSTPLKKGDEIELDLYKSSTYQYKATKKDAETEKNYKPVLKNIDGFVSSVK